MLRGHEPALLSHAARLLALARRGAHGTGRTGRGARGGRGVTGDNDADLRGPGDGAVGTTGTRSVPKDPTT